jgi:hypothetical protein
VNHYKVAMVKRSESCGATTEKIVMKLLVCRDEHGDVTGAAIQLFRSSLRL